MEQKVKSKLLNLSMIDLIDMIVFNNVSLSHLPDALFRNLGDASHLPQICMRAVVVEADRPNLISVDWNTGGTTSPEWFTQKLNHELKESFERDGFLVFDSLLDEHELKIYQDIYDRILCGEIDSSKHRHDLGNHLDRKTAGENICQIMWPSVYVKDLIEGPLHQRALAVARYVLGDDMAFDFDMLISKSPHTDTETPWHQDASYWLDLPDKRTVSCWVAMDQTMVNNGCMWFVPGSHLEPEIRPHRLARPGVHVRTCDCSEDEGKPVELRPGGSTFHHGRTLHYSRGNSTDKARRGFIVNFRPAEMVAYERERGFDHGQKGLADLVK